jgi:hypothetical protein
VWVHLHAWRYAEKHKAKSQEDSKNHHSNNVKKDRAESSAKAPEMLLTPQNPLSLDPKP